MTLPPPVVDSAAALARAAEIVAPWAEQSVEPEPGRLDVTVAAQSLLPALTALAASGWGRLSAITGLDLKPPPAAPGSRPAARPAAPAAPSTDDLEVLYHVCHGAAVLTLRVCVPRGHPVVPSVQPAFAYVDYFERELHELFGITVDGARSLDRLLLSDDWPADVYPLRRDAVLPPPPGEGS
jgi:NADH:ubiquinone oxidoreductase subunit C